MHCTKDKVRNEGDRQQLINYFLASSMLDPCMLNETNHNLLDIFAHRMNQIPDVSKDHLFQFSLVGLGTTIILRH